MCVCAYVRMCMYATKFKYQPTNALERRMPNAYGQNEDEWRSYEFKAYSHPTRILFTFEAQLNSRSIE